MSDICVTLPHWFGMQKWCAEGDLPGEPWTGREYSFYTGGGTPDIETGERVYVVHNRRLRGYAPLLRLVLIIGTRRVALVRGGGAVAVTIPHEVQGFRGWRYRFWSREEERPFPDWMVP